jgi:tetratricopeptide (TPR) repeat protein
MAKALFFGKGQILEAAHSQGCPRWACCQGKNIVAKYICDDMDESVSMLEEWLDKIQHSTEVWAIKFYEDDIKKIDSKTPHSCGFTFRMQEEEDYKNYVGAYKNNSQIVINKLEAIETRLNQLEEDPEEEEEEQGIGALMKDPERLQGMVSAVAGALALVKTIFSPGQPQAIPGAINGVPEDAEKLQRAIETLSKNDPKLAWHLEKLAHISETNKGTFDMLIGMLEKM